MPSYTLPTASPLLRLWYSFRTYRFPWRRRFFAGQDLSGNTYWELRDRLHPSRPRRTVEFDTSHGASMRDMMAAGVPSPQWHQWLRGVRVEAPSIEELVAEDKRVEVVRERARLIEERWEGEGRKRIVGGVGVVGERMRGAQGVGRLEGSAHASRGDGVLRGNVVGEGAEGSKETGVEDPWEKARREQEAEGPVEWTPKAGKR